MASYYAVSQVLEKYEDEFFEVVEAKVSLLRMKRKKVIDYGLISKIENADNKNAKEILFDHLKCNASVANLREYCKMVIEEGAYPKMQQLGEKMLSELPPEGVLSCNCIIMLAACVCTQLVHVCV